MKSISKLIIHLKVCISLPICIKPDCNNSILAEDNNAFNYFIYHNEEEYRLGNKKQDVEADQRELVSKKLDNKSIKDMLHGHTP